MPVSALKGDNIVNSSLHFDWYKGPSLLSYLETVEFDEVDNQAWRLPVQWVVRPQTDELHDYRGYAGRVVGNGLKVGDDVVILPSSVKSKIKRIELAGLDLDQAEDGQSVIVHLTDHVDISRGDTIVTARDAGLVERNIEANICWFDNKALDTNQIYLFQNFGRTTKVKINEIIHKVDINNQEYKYGEHIALNDIGRVQIKAAEDLSFDLYQDHQATGRGIIIDPRTNLTVAAVMIESVA